MNAETKEQAKATRRMIRHNMIESVWLVARAWLAAGIVFITIVAVYTVTH
jgi:hypothetical protein